MSFRPATHAEGAEPARVALEHAVRRWEAELENDRKLSQRENGLLAFVAALPGLSLFKLELLTEPGPSGWLWTVRGLVGTSLILLVGAIARFLLTPEGPPEGVLRTRKPRAEPISLSSALLRWPARPDRAPAGLTDPRAATVEPAS